VTTSLKFNYDASRDTPGDSTWENDGFGGASGNALDWTFDGGAMSPSAVSHSGVPGITAAYDFPEAVAASSNSYEFFGQNATGYSFELWFNAQDLNGQHVLFETGGGKGVALTLDGDQVHGFAGTNDLDVEKSATITQGWNQVVITGNMNTDQMQFFLNGGGRQTGALGNAESWSGGNPPGLGQVAGVVGGSVTPSGPFDGQIGLLRFYNAELSAADVEQNYTSIVPEPTSLALLGLGGLTMLGRSRRN
jgi:hypothetical protein